MAHSAGKNLSAVLLLVAIAAVAGRIHAAESASVGDYNLFPCNNRYHLSYNYKGPCFAWINTCNRVCLDESSDNISGDCIALRCWCETRCTSETVAAASAPILA
ncbi:hypothetical protein SETIT_8G231200v2 [Setaria italica]|uniref:Knottins-like domain-containing protein n=1 Tax=Setaria italica TaxID=4555 RepID=A0A368SAZ3_SETIT|nr:hypothetical protein SETIT_8G231200v2 [Setaria italica]